jgi:hypothetical protein
MRNIIKEAMADPKKFLGVLNEDLQRFFVAKYFRLAEGTPEQKATFEEIIRNKEELLAVLSTDAKEFFQERFAALQESGVIPPDTGRSEQEPDKQRVGEVNPSCTTQLSAEHQENLQDIRTQLAPHAVSVPTSVELTTIHPVEPTIQNTIQQLAEAAMSPQSQAAVSNTSLPRGNSSPRPGDKGGRG